MIRYFEIREWAIDELCESIRRRIAESKIPLPPKKMKHCVSIYYRTSETSYQGCFREFGHFNIKTREQAIKALDACAWLERDGDNSWIEAGIAPDYYECKDGTMKKKHYFIEEYDYECYEDEEYHTEYTPEEVEKLREALYAIEKAKYYIRAYDYCEDQCSFGEGRFVEEVNEELEKFEKDFTEEPQPNDYDD